MIRKITVIIFFWMEVYPEKIDSIHRMQYTVQFFGVFLHPLKNYYSHFLKIRSKRCNTQWGSRSCYIHNILVCFSRSWWAGSGPDVMPHQGFLWERTTSTGICWHVYLRNWGKTSSSSCSVALLQTICPHTPWTTMCTSTTYRKCKFLSSE